MPEDRIPSFEGVVFRQAVLQNKSQQIGHNSTMIGAHAVADTNVEGPLASHRVEVQDVRFLGRIHGLETASRGMILARSVVQ